MGGSIETLEKFICLGIEVNKDRIGGQARGRINEHKSRKTAHKIAKVFKGESESMREGEHPGKVLQLWLRDDRVEETRFWTV